MIKGNDEEFPVLCNYPPICTGCRRYATTNKICGTCKWYTNKPIVPWTRDYYCSNEKSDDFTRLLCCYAGCEKWEFDETQTLHEV